MTINGEGILQSYYEKKKKPIVEVNLAQTIYFLPYVIVSKEDEEIITSIGWKQGYGWWKFIKKNNKLITVSTPIGDELFNSLKNKYMETRKGRWEKRKIELEEEHWEANVW